MMPPRGAALIPGVTGEPEPSPGARIPQRGPQRLPGTSRAALSGPREGGEHAPLTQMCPSCSWEPVNASPFDGSRRDSGWSAPRALWNPKVLTRGRREGQRRRRDSGAEVGVMRPGARERRRPLGAGNPREQLSPGAAKGQSWVTATGLQPQPI